MKKRRDAGHITAIVSFCPIPNIGPCKDPSLGSGHPSLCDFKYNQPTSQGIWCAGRILLTAFTQSYHLKLSPLPQLKTVVGINSILSNGPK